jgi:hypothetical protein
LERQEGDWGDQHETDLAKLVETVPTSWSGLLTMAKVVAHQADQGADAALITAGIRSLAFGLSHIGAKLQ